MSEIDFLKTMQLMSDSGLMLDEDRLSQVVGEGEKDIPDSSAEADPMLSADAGARLKAACLEKTNG